jgi:hypothetical protein
MAVPFHQHTGKCHHKLDVVHGDHLAAQLLRQKTQEDIFKAMTEVIMAIPDQEATVKEIVG